MRIGQEKHYILNIENSERKTLHNEYWELKEKHYIMNIENWEKEKTLHNEYWERKKTLHNEYWELRQKKHYIMYIKENYTKIKSGIIQDFFSMKCFCSLNGDPWI